MGEENKVRLDRWLWAARFYKTRVLAVNAVKHGQVSLNGQRTKPARAVSIGDEVIIRKAQLVYEVTVCGLSERRLGARLAQDLYREVAESIRAREQRVELIKAQRQVLVDGRPSKKDRRVQLAFKRRNNAQSP